MKKWIMWMFCINKDLDSYFEKIEKRIHCLSLNTTMSCRQLYSKIISLNNKKSVVVNLRVLFNIVSQALSKDELDFLILQCKKNRQSDKMPANELLAKKSLQKTEFNRLISFCQDIAVKKGFSTKRFERDYLQFFVNKAV